MDGDTFVNMMFCIAGGLILLSLLPWWLLLAVGAGMVIPWYKRWRFKWIEPAEVKKFLDFSDIGYGTIGDVEKMMFIGMSDDKSVRWWYWRGDDGVKDWLVPQAVDNGQIYWNKKLEIKNPVLLKHLHGFWDMGNEWPGYYKMINKQVEQIKKQEKKKKKANANIVKHPTSFDPEVIKAVESDLPRADYAIVDPDNNNLNTITAAMASQSDLLELQQAVKELEEEIHGKCPTLEFDTKP